jgi:hypothetical protein
MSWSISLSGPPEVVTREISDALLLLDRALDYSQNSDADTVTASLSGYVSWKEDGSVTASNVSFSVGEAYNQEQPSE